MLLKWQIKDFSRQKRQLIQVSLTGCLPSAWGPQHEFTPTIIEATILAKSSDYATE